MWIKWLEECRTLTELQRHLGLSSKSAALAWARKNVPLESEYQDRIIKYLEDTFPDAAVWKQANGVYSSKNGLPDVAMLHRGQYYAFEVKRPFLGKVTAIQRITIRRLKRAGGKVYVVIYVSDVKKIIKALGLI